MLIGYAQKLIHYCNIMAGNVATERIVVPLQDFENGNAYYAEDNEIVWNGIEYDVKASTTKDGNLVAQAYKDDVEHKLWKSIAEKSKNNKSESNSSISILLFCAALPSFSASAKFRDHISIKNATPHSQYEYAFFAQAIRPPSC